MPQLRPDALTPVAIPDVYDALAAAWREQLGTEPARATLLVLLAQWAEETGRGRSMHCFNTGNIKGRPDGSDGRDWCFFRCSEVLGGRVVWFDPPHPACCFRAYPDLAAGVADYLEELRRRFASAWPAVEAGDPAAFAHHLKLAHYYTADEGAYTRSLVSLVAELGRIVDAAPPDPAAGRVTLDLAAAVDAGAEGLPPDTERSAS